MDATWSEDELNFDGVLCDDDDDQEVSEDEVAPNPTSYSAYRRKYLLLLERCVGGKTCLFWNISLLQTK